jgi:hypothetical protein
MRRYFLGLALIIACIAAGPRPSLAGGALAIALPKDVIKDGFAYGSAYNYPTTEEASKRALEKCQETKSDLRKKLCKVINAFQDQCVAVAMDPADGTPGVGWAITNDLLSAERIALEKCEATAGPGRAPDFDRGVSSGCGGVASSRVSWCASPIEFSGAPQAGSGVSGSNSCQILFRSVSVRQGRSAIS